MSDYDYTSRGNTANGRRGTGFRFQSWGVANNEGEKTDGWSRPGFLSKAEGHRDHVCRPVIVGADGRVMPGVVECPTNHHKDGIVSKTETTIENAYRLQPANAYTRDYVFGKRWDQNRGEAAEGQEFFSSVQTAASEGSRTGFLQRAKANYNPYGGYEGTNDMSTNRWGASEPTLITTDGWTRPSRAGRAMPPEAPLGKVTNDIDAAADYLREPARPPSSAMFGADRWSSASASPPAYQARKKEPATTTTIDSKEAAKRYGGQFIW